MKQIPAIPGFWAYDLFGYLLPGSFILAVIGRFSSIGHDLVADPWDQGKPHDIAMLVGVAYVLGHVISAFASFLLEKVTVKLLFGYPTAAMFPKAAKKDQFWLVRFWKTLRPFLLPGYYRAYTEGFQERVNERFSVAFGFEPSEDHDRFWVIWAWVAMNCPVAHRRATHFLDLYGFSRNCSFVFLATAVLPFITSASLPVAPWFWVLLTSASSLALFVNYAKHMRRMTDEIYRAFVAAPQDSKPPTAPDDGKAATAEGTTGS